MRAQYFEKMLKAIVKFHNSREAHDFMTYGKVMDNLVTKAEILLDRDSNPASVMKELDNEDLR